jgi:replicative DNA helicase
MALSPEQIRESLRAKRQPPDAVQSPPPANNGVTEEPVTAESRQVFHAEQSDPLPEERPASIPKARSTIPSRSHREKNEMSILNREPPHSVDIELAFIGAMCQHPVEGIPFAKANTVPGFFYVPTHLLLFNLALNYFEEHGDLEFFAFQEYLKAAGHLDAIGGPVFLTSVCITGNYPFSAMEYYANILREKYLRRELIASHADAARRAQDESVDVDSLIESDRARSEQIAAFSRPQKSALTVRTLNELVGMTFDEADNYFGDRIMAAGQACTLLGPGGIGKSRLSMQLAVCMITGREFLDMSTRAKNMKWLFVQSENNNRRLHYDLNNMIAALGLTQDEITLLNQHLFIHTLENDVDSFLNLINPQNYAAVHALIQDVKPNFVQWDPLNSLTDNDLNSDMDMRAVVSAISRITRQGDHNRVPFVLHHSLTGKIGAARAVGWDKASYGRNSKVLQAWTRAQINLAPREADNPNLLIMSCGKNNNGKAFPEIGVEFDEDAGIYIRDDSFDPEEFREEVGINTGQFKARYTKDLLLEELSVLDGTKPTALRRLMDEKHGMSKSHFYRFARELQDKNSIVERDGEWFKNVPKS